MTKMTVQVIPAARASAVRILRPELAVPRDKPVTRRLPAIWPLANAAARATLIVAITTTATVLKNVLTICVGREHLSETATE